MVDSLYRKRRAENDYQNFCLATEKVEKRTPTQLLLEAGSLDDTFKLFRHYRNRPTPAKTNQCSRKRNAVLLKTWQQAPGEKGEPGHGHERGYTNLTCSRHVEKKKKKGSSDYEKGK